MQFPHLILRPERRAKVLLNNSGHGKGPWMMINDMPFMIMRNTFLELYCLSKSTTKHTRKKGGRGREGI